MANREGKVTLVFLMYNCTRKPQREVADNTQRKGGQGNADIRVHLYGLQEEIRLDNDPFRAGQEARNLSRVQEQESHAALRLGLHPDISQKLTLQAAEGLRRGGSLRRGGAFFGSAFCIDSVGQGEGADGPEGHHV